MGRWEEGGAEPEGDAAPGPDVPTPESLGGEDAGGWVGRTLGGRRSSFMPEAARNSLPAKKGRKGRGKYPRRAVPGRKAQQEAERNAHNEELRAYFAKVDSYALEEASPGGSSRPEESDTHATSPLKPLRETLGGRLAAVAEADEAASPAASESTSGSLSESGSPASEEAGPSPAGPARPPRRSSILVRPRTSSIDPRRSSLFRSSVAALESMAAEPGRHSSSAALAAALVAAPPARRASVRGPSLGGAPSAASANRKSVAEGRLSLLPLAEEGGEEELEPLREEEALAIRGAEAEVVKETETVPEAEAEEGEGLETTKAPLLPVAEEGDNEELLGEVGGPIERLLRECGQAPNLEVVPSLGDFISGFVDLREATKIGEGTFGEAFMGAGRVFKIIPIEGTLLVNGEVQKTADEVRAESVIANKLTQMSREACPDTGSPTANMSPGFIRMYGMGACRGRYPDELVHQWEAWDEENESENDHIGAFPEDQLYIVFVFENGGRDLERFQLHNFDEVRSLLLQVVLTLAVGEEACGFEHRDLHWGNVLLDRCPGEAEARFRLRGVDVSMQTSGLKTSLIDFTLSRLQADSGEIAFCDLSADPELFRGPKGDVQADTYRRMKKATRGDWQEHRPKTNSLWVHYLADILLHQKQWGATPDELQRLKRFRRATLGYASAAEAVWDELFEDLWVSGAEAV